MPDRDDDAEAKLTLPSLSLRRRRRRARAGAAESEVPTSGDGTSKEEPGPDESGDVAAVVESAPDEPVEVVDETDEVDTAGDTAAPEVTADSDTATDEAGDENGASDIPTGSDDTAVKAPEDGAPIDGAEELTASDVDDEPAGDDVAAVDQMTTDAEPTVVLPSDQAEGDQAAAVASADATGEMSDEPGDVDAEEPAAFESEESGPDDSALFSLPRLPAPVIMVITGLIVGVVGVLLTWVAARGCDTVRGVGSCGGFGFVALIAILAVALLLGTVLLRLWQVPDAGSTSALAVGALAMLTMLFLLGSIESRWMLLVIPLLTAATFVLSWWVGSRFGDAGVQARRD